MSSHGPNPLEQSPANLPRDRLNSPSMQVLILCIVVFLVPGMNSLLVGLGAGGSHPSNIAVVDKINLVSTVFMIVGGIFGGSLNNQVGPKYTMLIGTSGYPIYIGSLWWLDQGRSPIFAYFAAVYKGTCGGFLYTAIGYISMAYAQEKHRGIYIGAVSSAIGIGSVVGSSLVLGLTAQADTKLSHVPWSVYVSIIALQSTGVLVSTLLLSPTKIRRNQGQGVPLPSPKTWREELESFPKSIMIPSVLLTSVALFSCQMIFSLMGSLNAFYFNARTRALVNLIFWLSSAISSVIFGLVFDGKWLGKRRRRSFIVSCIVASLLLGSHSGLLSFLATHNIDRKIRPLGIDWTNSRAFASLLVIYIFVGISSYVFQNYLLWLLATFTNDPSTLSNYSGYVEASKALGVIISLAIDSRHTAFLTEEILYFSLLIVGMILCTLSSLRYTRNVDLNEEVSDIPPSLLITEESLSDNSMLSSIKEPDVIAVVRT